MIEIMMACFSDSAIWPKLYYWYLSWDWLKGHLVMSIEKRWMFNEHIPNLKLFWKIRSQFPLNILDIDWLFVLSFRSKLIVFQKKGILYRKYNFLIEQIIRVHVSKYFKELYGNRLILFMILDLIWWLKVQIWFYWFFF